MAKNYNILKADPAGEVWTNSHNNQMQTFFLTLEGVNDQRGGKAVMINRMAGSPLLGGEAYLELTETPSKSKPGTTYFKAKLEQAPPGAPSSKQTTMPVTESGPLSWGQAVIAASTMLSSEWGNQILKDGGLPAMLSLAKDIYVSTPPDKEVVALAEEAKADILPDEVDIKDIPF